MSPGPTVTGSSSPVALMCRRKLPETPPTRTKFSNNSSGPADKNLGSSGTKTVDMTHQFFKATTINIELKTLLFCDSLSKLASLASTTYKHSYNYLTFSITPSQPQSNVYYLLFEPRLLIFVYIGGVSGDSVDRRTNTSNIGSNFIRNVSHHLI